MQSHRRRAKKIDLLEVRSAREALRLRRLAHALGIKRDWLLRKAKQFEVSSQSSERLRPPE